MLFRTHLIFSFFVGLLLIDYFKFGLIFLLFVLIGSILPDIDRRGSKIGKKFKILNFLITTVFDHRGFFHSLFPLAIFYLIFNNLLSLSEIGFGLIIGYGSHILIDAFTSTGIRFFYPLINFRFRGFLRTGSFLESVLFIFLVIVSFLRVRSVFF